jgi:hypothetical protein
LTKPGIPSTDFSRQQGPEMSRKPTITNVHPAGPDHQVLTLNCASGDRFSHRKTICPDCPWRKDSKNGAFPAEAFRHSATTAYDMATTTFACHHQGSDKPATCAGFLLKGAEHNLSVRLAMIKGRYDPRAIDAKGVELHAGYRSMAIANGVDPDDPAIAPCRGDDEL